jgi:hypothetical protein
VAPSEASAVELAVMALERLLDRPVFLSEITQAGFSRTSPLRQLGRKERTETVKRLAKSGVEVREGEPLFSTREDRGEEVHVVLCEALLDAMDAQGERPREVRQTALTLEQFG